MLSIAATRGEGEGVGDRRFGVDASIEAVGVPATFEMATELIRPGGTVANVGVHGRSVELRLQDLSIKDVAITTGLVSAATTPMLLKLVAQGKLSPEELVSHRFTFDSIVDAYDTFVEPGGVGERVPGDRLLGGVPVRMRLTGTSHFLPLRVRGRVGTARIRPGTWRGVSSVRISSVARR
jgi:Zinc-binding dehydrogenase